MMLAKLLPENEKRKAIKIWMKFHSDKFIINTKCTHRHRACAHRPSTFYAKPINNIKRQCELAARNVGGLESGGATEPKPEMERVRLCEHSILEIAKIITSTNKVERALQRGRKIGFFSGADERNATRRRYIELQA